MIMLVILSSLLLHSLFCDGSYLTSLNVTHDIPRRHISGASKSKSDPPTQSEIQSFLQQLASRRRPVVFGGVDEMFSKEDFNPSYLSMNNDFEMEGIRYQPDPSKSTFAIMTPSDDQYSLRTSTGLGGLDESGSVGIVTPDPEGLLDATFSSFEASAGAGPLMYWTSDVRGTPLNNSVSTWPALRVFDDLGIDSVDDDAVHVPMLWISHPTVAAQTHYDKSHNYFVQLWGSKTVTLFPPAYSRFMYSYPSVHAGRKMSQVPFMDEVDAFPNATQLKGYEVELKAGEMLYIPPYWWHYIRAGGDDVAISLSVVSPSWEEAHLSRTEWTPLPIGSIDTHVEKVVSAQAILVHIISRVKTLGTPKLFSDFLYEDRWRAMYPEHVEYGECLGASDAEEADKFLERVQGTDLGERIETSAKEIGKMINDDMINQGIRLTFVGDYVEQLARWAVGPDKVAGFVRNCLQFEMLEFVEEVEGLDAIIEGADGDPNNLHGSGEL